VVCEVTIRTADLVQVFLGYCNNPFCERNQPPALQQYAVHEGCHHWIFCFEAFFSRCEVLSSAGSFHTQVRFITDLGNSGSLAAAIGVPAHAIGVMNATLPTYVRLLVFCRALLVGVLAGVAVSAPKAFAMDIREAQARWGHRTYEGVSIGPFSTDSTLCCGYAQQVQHISNSRGTSVANHAVDAEYLDQAPAQNIGPHTHSLNTAKPGFLSAKRLSFVQRRVLTKLLLRSFYELLCLPYWLTAYGLPRVFLMGSK
jgi:hypothetical protein